MVDDAGPLGLDAVKAVFDDQKVVSDAGIVLLATLATRRVSRVWLIGSSAWIALGRGLVTRGAK
jgi:hypothetical protein